MRNPFKFLRRLARPAGTVAAATGAVAVLNRRLRNTGSAPQNHVGGLERRWNWRGYDIFVTELGEGDPEIVLIHGIYAGASSYEYRKLAPLLARHRKVIVFDLLGCGLSDRPNLAYSADLFVDLIVDALGEFTTGPVTLAGSSLGAAFAIRAAVRAPERIGRLVTFCPTGLRGALAGTPSSTRSLIGAALRAPVIGEGLFNGLVSRPSIRWHLERRAYADHSSITDDVIDQYYSSTHQAGARFVPAAFIGGALNCSVALDLPFITLPVLIGWGAHAPAGSSPEQADDFLALTKDGRPAIFEHSGLLPHEEEPAAAAAAIEDFIAQPVPQ